MNTVTGTVSAVRYSSPLGDDGQVLLQIGSKHYPLLLRGDDTDIDFDGQIARGSDVLVALADAERPVEVILWLRDGASTTAKFNTSDP